MKNEEHHLQVACVRWFSLQFPKLRHLLIAIPNGGKRHPKTAAAMKAEGAKAGAPDLFFAVPREYHNPAAGLWIEMKTPTGRLRPNQREYLKRLSEQGYAVAVCRCFNAFENIILDYLQGAYENDPKLTQ
jgi:hypothetical protein